MFNCQIFSWLAFGIKGCSSKTRFISSIFRLSCPALCHYVREHIIYTVYSVFRLCASVCLRISAYYMVYNIYAVYSDCVLMFAFAFLSCKKQSALNRTFSTESYRNWRKSVKILKNNGLFLKNRQQFERKRIMG